ncbi:MAG: hypothetical protein IT521_02030 [Burkholderiales bacterium]|nr:hypothetical protein [Burkholderiales bacterium]
MAIIKCSSTSPRPDDAEYVTIPRRTLCELAFVVGQLQSRLAFRTPSPPGRVDAQILENAKTALVNARAALELAIARRPS